MPNLNLRLDPDVHAALWDAKEAFAKQEGRKVSWEEFVARAIRAFGNGGAPSPKPGRRK